MKRNQFYSETGILRRYSLLPQSPISGNLGAQSLCCVCVVVVVCVSVGEEHSGQRLMPSVFLSHYFLRHGRLLNQELTDSVSLPGRKPQDLLSASLLLGLQVLPPRPTFYMGARNPILILYPLSYLPSPTKDFYKKPEKVVAAMGNS